MIDEERGQCRSRCMSDLFRQCQITYCRNAFGQCRKARLDFSNDRNWIKTMDRFLVAFVSLAAWSAAAVAQEEGKAHPQAVLGEISMAHGRGKPAETAAAGKGDDKPPFSQQTRAPYYHAADWKVTVLTDKLHLPWSVEFLPDETIC